MCIRVVCVRFVHYDLNSSACTVVIVFATLHVCTCVSYTGHEDFHSMDERVRVIVQYLRDGDVHTSGSVGRPSGQLLGAYYSSSNVIYTALYRTQT